MEMKITKKMTDEFNYLMRSWVRSNVGLKELLETTKSKELKKVLMREYAQKKIKETLGKLKEKNAIALKLKAAIQAVGTNQITHETYVKAFNFFKEVVAAKIEAQEKVWKEKLELMTNQLEKKDLRINELYDLIACMGHKIEKLQTCVDVFV